MNLTELHLKSLGIKRGFKCKDLDIKRQVIWDKYNYFF